LHQVGVSFDLYCDARKHKIKTSCAVECVGFGFKLGTNFCSFGLSL